MRRYFILAVVSVVSLLTLNSSSATQGFVTAKEFPVGSPPHSLVVADFNGDGKLDTAVANGGSSTISVLLGKGNGAYNPQTKFVVGQSPAIVAAGDLNGDGKADLVITTPKSQRDYCFFE